MIAVDGAEGKILKLNFPNVTAADYGVYVVVVPLDGETIDSPGISLRQIGKIPQKRKMVPYIVENILS